MNAKVIFVLLLCTLLLIPISVSAQEGNQPTLSKSLKQRQAIAESDVSLSQISEQQISATGSALAEAIDIGPSILADASVSGPSGASAVFEELGVIRPKQGSTFALLSSGDAGTSQPEPGTDFPPVGTVGDKTTLTLTLNLPEGVNRLSFAYNFLTAEFPEFVGREFNDTFIAVLTDNAGTREIARADVNSSEFAPASTSIAAGSGFDIVTEDTEGVDDVFGTTGQPDAGLTGFQLANVSVAGGGTVVLEFSIEDLGDGILDSAVILDNLVVSSLQVVDPNPVTGTPTFLAEGEIINDPEKLARGGDSRDGAAADGVTKVLLRNKVSGPGTVEFCLAAGNATEDGGLALLGGTDEPANCVNAPVVETSQGFIAFAIYQTPGEFKRPGRDEDEALAERPLGFRARFTPNTGDVVENEIPFTLERPPVVLVHGIWFGAWIWDLPLPFPLISDPRFDVTTVHYTDTSASHFSDSVSAPFNSQGGIKHAITSMRKSGIAATQVDIAGYSTGGIVVRNYVMSNPEYRRNNNFNAGDIHKLITLNTPHTGTPWAHSLGVIEPGSLGAKAFSLFGMPVDLGAIDDLASGTAIINASEQTSVPSHALVGIGGSDALALAPDPLGAFYKVVNFFADTSELFQGLQHDFLVDRQSQEGGMPNNAISPPFGAPDGIHFFVPNSTNYSNRLIELFNSPATGSLFAQFPAPSSLSSFAIPQRGTSEPVTPASAVTLQAEEPDSLLITSPAESTEVSSGDTVPVIVEPKPGVVVNQVLLVGPGVAQVGDEAPFEFDFTVPLEAAGAFELFAVGKDSTGNFFGSNTISLHVTPPAVLESITLVPRNPILFAIGESLSFIVMGNFADGTVRDITSPTTGTEYLTSSPEIVTVSPEGMITSTGVGIATVAARNGSIQDSISVTVLLENQAPIANSGPDQTVSVGNTVTLDGTGSFDPDDGPEPLSFSWLQVAGTEVSLTDSTTATPTFTPSVAGDYTFGLIVSDGQEDSESDSITVTVLPPEADVKPTITLDPTEGAPGTEVTATGSGWTAGHEVSVQWDDGTELTATTVDSNGSFTVSFTVPANATEGEHTIDFVGVPPEGEAYSIPATFTVTVPAVSLPINNTTPGYYNNALGTILDGTQLQFPPADSFDDEDPTILPADEPDLSPAADVLGDWLTADPFPLNSNWSGLQSIPPTWVTNTETAIIYLVDAGPDPVANLRGSFGVDNGIFVWVNGEFRFGALGPGRVNGLEYTDIDLGSLNPGLNSIQILREDHGNATGFTLEIAEQPESEPSITLDPTEGAPGTEVTATGSGWSAGHEVNVQWEDGTELTATTVDSNGSFTVSFTVPANATEGEHTIDFVGVPPEGEAYSIPATFTVTTSADTEPPTVSWVKPVGNGEFYPTTSGIVELEVAVSDNAGIQSVEFYRWDAVNLQDIGITTVSSPPYQANVEVNSLNIEWNEIFALVTDTAGNQAQASIFIYRQVPTITLDPTEGPPGTEVTVQGSGWISGDTVIIAALGGESVEATVEDSGNFATTFTVPTNTEVGEQLVIAGTAEASHQADAAFQVTESSEIPPPEAQPTITLDPTEGPPGTEVTATGSGWSAGHEVSVQWDDGTELTATTVDDNGDFTGSFSVPDDVAEGSYTVYFYDVPPDGGSGYFIPATFTVTAPAETPPGATISVPGDQPWTDTGLDLAEGSSVAISASGTIKIAGSDPGKTPAGDPGCIQSESGVAPGLTCNSLVGRIGEDGAPFEVGTSLSLSVETAGRLYLGVNDEIHAFGDNSGNWTVDITVSDASN